MRTSNNKIPISGLVLAGGRSSRMGRDKALIRIGEHTLLERSINELQAQCADVWISCPPNCSYELPQGLQSIKDLRDDYSGPLAGIEAALHRISCDYLLIAPCDCLEIPSNLATTLHSEMQAQQSPIAYAKNADGDQYLCALIQRGALNALRDYLNRGERKVGLFFQQQGACAVSRPDWRDCFININTPDQLRDFEEKEEQRRAAMQQPKSEH